MDELKTAVQPLTDLLPAGVRDFLDAGGWWLVLGILALLALLLVQGLLRWLIRLLFGRRRGPAQPSDQDLYEDLACSPLPVHPPGEYQLTVYHLPVRLRLVVVAPAGKDGDVDATAIEKLLERVVPGLGGIMFHDKPRVRVWPPQLSQQGFVMAFHRRVRKPDPEGEPSRWVLAVGRAQVGKQTVLIGLGLWADEPNSLGKVTLEPHQWLDVLRLKRAED